MTARDTQSVESCSKTFVTYKRRQGPGLGYKRKSYRETTMFPHLLRVSFVMFSISKRTFPFQVRSPGTGLIDPSDSRV